MVGEGTKALYSVCERVPGTTAAGVRLGQLMVSLGEHLDMDGLSLKGQDMPHIQRLGTGRMMRVPAPDTPFLDRVSAFQRALHRQLEGEAYELVHAFDVWTAAVAIQHQERSEFKLVTELDELPSETLNERARGSAVDEKARASVRRAELQVIQNSHAVVVSTATAARALVQAGVPEARVHVIPPGIEESVFAAAAAPAGPGEDGVLSVLYAGTADPNRGLGTFLTALKALPPHVRAILCRTRKEPAAEEAVATLGLQGRVSWQEAGTAAQLATALASAHVVVLLPLAPLDSLHGARVPRRLLEAMMGGRPVVVGEVRGLKDAVEDRDSVMVVPARNARALGSALGQLVADGALRERLGSRAREVAAGFTWPPRLRAYAALYDQLLGTRVAERLGRSAEAVLAKARAARKSTTTASVVVREERSRAPAPAALPKVPPERRTVPNLDVAPELAAEPDAVTGQVEMLDDAELMPLEVGTEMLAEAEDSDPWGGDTVAYSGPPPQMEDDGLTAHDTRIPVVPESEATELVPLPDLESLRPVLPAPQPAPVFLPVVTPMRAPAGMRSLALLDSVELETTDALPAPPPANLGPRVGPSTSRAHTLPTPPPAVPAAERTDPAATTETTDRNAGPGERTVPAGTVPPPAAGKAPPAGSRADPESTWPPYKIPTR